MKRYLLLAIVLALPFPAAAQGDGQYRDLIDQAVGEFDAQRFEEARALFRQAHGVSPSARTLRGVGLASFEMGDYIEAYRALSASLDDERRALTETQRADVSAVLTRARGFVGVYALSLSPDGAEVRVDGEAATRGQDGRLILALGSHRLSASAPEHREAIVALEVRGGEEETLTLHAAAVTSQATVDAPLVAEPTATPDAPGQTPDPAPAIAVVVTGGTLAGASVVLGLAWWLGRQDQVDRCTEAGAACFNLADVTTARDASAATTLATSVLGVAGLVTGAVLFATLDDGDASDVACAPTGVGLACAGRF